MILSKIFAYFLCALSHTHSAFSESVNPFNQFSAPAGGVDLFSGNATVNHPLLSFSGRGGMGADIALQYSSNVHMNVVANNKVAPTKWLGLGWRLGFGQIICVHNHTVGLSDDKYMYISAQGVSQDILKGAEGKFYLSNEPYWKVERIVSQANANVIIAWKLTDATGKTYMFGDNVENPESKRSATRYIYYWEGNAKEVFGHSMEYNVGYVGNGTHGSGVWPKYYPHTWDLAGIEDVNGNKVTFEYQQYVQKIKGVNKVYTKSSYLKKIINPEGAYITFKTKDKDADEYWDYQGPDEDPHGGIFGEEQTRPEFDGDGFMEFLETQLLEEIAVHNTQGDIIREFEFCYKKVNEALYKSIFNPKLKYEGSFAKSLLVKISEKLGANILNETVFEYYDTWLDHKIKNNFGALKKIRGKNCGSITYEYEKKELQNIYNGVARSVVNKNGFYGNYSKFHLKSSFVNGQRFIVLLGKGDDMGKLSILHWDRNIRGGIQEILIKGKPYNHKYKICDATDIEATENAILLYNRNRIWILEWKNGRWRDSDVWGSYSTMYSAGYHNISKIKYVTAGYGRFAWAVGNTKDSRVNTIKAAYKKDGKWITENVQGDAHVSHDDDLGTYRFKVKSIQHGNNFILVNWQDYGIANINYYAINTWDGNFWPVTYISKREDKHSHLISAGDFIAVYDEDPGIFKDGDVWTSALRWNGIKWKRSPWDMIQHGQHPLWHPSIQGAGENYYLIRYSDNEYLKSYNWNGEEWTEQGIGDYETNVLFAMNRENIRSHAGRDFFSVEYPRVWRTEVCTSFWKYDLCFDSPFRSVEMYAKVDIYRKKNNKWERDPVLGDSRTLGNGLTRKEVIPGEDFFAAKASYHNSYGGGVYVWNGLEYIKGMSWKGFLPSFDIESLGGNMFMLTQGRKFEGEEEKEEVKYLFYKYKNKILGNFYSYVVKKKKIFDPISGSPEIVYEYDYNPTNFNMKTGTFFNEDATIIMPGGNGKVKNYYYNAKYDKDILTTEPEYMGNVYKTETYSGRNDNKWLSKTEIMYETYSNPVWPGDIKQVRQIKTITSGKGLKTETIVGYYNDGTFVSGYNNLNGLPAINTIQNSNGDKKIKVKKFAFEYASETGDGVHYAAMRDKNMLLQEAQTLEYHNQISNENVIRANVQTYSASPAGFENNAPSPYKNYQYHNKDGKGYKDFNFNNTTGNETGNWQLTGTISGISKNGLVKQSNDISGLSSSVIYRNNLFSMATVQNASHDNVAVFTADYDNDPDGQYFDRENGWLKGGAVLNETVGYFGEAAIFVESGDMGPNKSVNISDSRDFLFTAWVKTDRDNVNINLKVGSSDFLALVKTANKWTLVTRKVPNSLLRAGSVTIAVGPNGNAFHVNDIRFYPYGAMVSTEYFSKKLNQVIAAIDASNVPAFSEYDGFGRVIKNYGTDTKGNKVLLSENEYNFNRCRIGDLSYDKMDIKVFIKDIEEYYDFDFDFNADNKTYDIKLPTHWNEIGLEVELENDDVIVEIKVDGDKITDACANKCSHPIALDKPLVKVEVGVESDTYVLNFQKLASCWQPNHKQGVSDRSAVNPVITMTDATTAIIAFSDLGQRGKGILKTWDSENEKWQPIGGTHFSNGKVRDISLVADKSVTPAVPYVAFIDKTIKGTGNFRYYENSGFVKKYDGSWQTIGGASFSTGDVKAVSMDVDGGVPYIIYIGDANAEVEQGSPVLVSSNYTSENDKLELVFDRPVLDASFNASGTVSLTVDNGGANTISFATPLSMETGAEENDRSIFISVSSSDAAIIEGWFNAAGEDQEELEENLEISLNAGLVADPTNASSTAITFSDNSQTSYDNERAIRPTNYQVYVKKYKDGSWLAMGPNSGRISKYGASSIAISVYNEIPYVAMVANVQYDCNNTDVTIPCPENAEKTELQWIIVSKWDPAANDGNGNWTKISDIPTEVERGDVIHEYKAGNIKLVVDNGTPYIAYDREYITLIDEENGIYEAGNDRAVIVRKYDEDETYLGSHWIPVTNPVAGDMTRNDTYIFFMNGYSKNYSFDVKSGTPMLAFLSDYNKERATVIKHDGTKWKSIGNPAFVKVEYGDNFSAISLASTDQDPPVPYLALIEDKGSNAGRASVFEYCTDCPDVTFSNLIVKDQSNESIELEWDFKQYYLYYRASVAYEKSTIKLNAVPQTCDDFSKIKIKVNNGDFREQSGCAFSDFEVVLNEGLNTILVRGIAAEENNFVDYTLDIFRAYNPVPSKLSFEFSTKKGVLLDIGPDFEIGNYGPYKIDGVGTADDIIHVKKISSENVTVRYGDVELANDNNVDVALGDGLNTLTFLVDVGGKEQSYTFKILRQISDDPLEPVLPPISEVVSFSEYSDFSIIRVPIIDKRNIYTYTTSSDLKGLWVLQPVDGNTKIYANGIHLTPGVAAFIPIATGNPRIKIVDVVSEQEENEYFINIILDPTLSQQAVIRIGKREADPETQKLEPLEFYHYQTLAEAHEKLKEDIEADDNPNDLPSGYIFYVMPDWGTNFVTSPAANIEAFKGVDKVGRGITIIGVLKGSELHRQLMDEFEENL